MKNTSIKAGGRGDHKTVLLSVMYTFRLYIINISPEHTYTSPRPKSRIVGEAVMLQTHQPMGAGANIYTSFLVVK